MKETSKDIRSGADNFWRGVIGAGLVTGLLWGLIFGLELAGLGDLLPYPKDTFIFVLVLSLLSMVIWTGIFAIIGLIARLLSQPAGFLYGIGIFSILFSQSMIFWIEANRPVSFASLKIIFGGAVSLLVSALVTYYLIRLFAKMGSSKLFRLKISPWLRAKFWLSAYLPALAMIVVVISVVASSSPIRKNPLKNIEPAGKVLFLGVDAACWENMQPLLDAGRLPNFAKLIKEGSAGRLPSLVSLYNPFANTITMGIKSAAVWNSILTGKSPARHGIKDFIYTEIPGIKHPFRYPLLPSFTPARERVEKALGLKSRPFNRLQRKSKAIWNILTDAGIEVGALGFWTTWPEEEINGDFLSDRFEDTDLPQRWFPDTLVSEAEVDSMLALMQTPALEDLRYFTAYDYDPQFKDHFSKDSREYLHNDLLTNLFKSYYQDRFRSELGLRLMRQHEYAFLAVYFYGLDTAGHAFTRFQHPELFADVQPKEVEYFGQIIAKYYEWIDAEIGKYLSQMDPSTTVLLCSDHGMGPWIGNRLAKKDVRLSGSHRKDGMVILSGNVIQSGKRISPKNVLDILPTALYLVGLPVAKDMEGTVLTEAIRPEILAARPIGKIHTYETEKWRMRGLEAVVSSQSVDEKMLQKLRGLGYLK